MHRHRLRAPGGPLRGHSLGVRRTGARADQSSSVDHRDDLAVYPVVYICPMLGISLISSCFIAVDIVLLVCFITLSFVRRFHHITGIIKFSEYQRGKACPARDVSDKHICVVGCGVQGLRRRPLSWGTLCLLGLGEWAAHDVQFFTAVGSFPCSKDDLPCRTTPFKEYVDYLGRFAVFYRLRPFLNFNVPTKFLCSGFRLSSGAFCFAHCRR